MVLKNSRPYKKNNLEAKYSNPSSISKLCVCVFFSRLGIPVLTIVRLGTYLIFSMCALDRLAFLQREILEYVHTYIQGSCFFFVVAETVLGAPLACNYTKYHEKITQNCQIMFNGAPTIPGIGRINVAFRKQKVKQNSPEVILILF